MHADKDDYTCVLDTSIVVALSVYDHHWTFYIIYRGGINGGEANARASREGRKEITVAGGATSTNAHAPCIVHGPFPAGHTATLLGTFQLVRFIGVLRKWVAEEWMKTIEEAAIVQSISS